MTRVDVSDSQGVAESLQADTQVKELTQVIYRSKDATRSKGHRYILGARTLLGAPSWPYY